MSRTKKLELKEQEIQKKCASPIDQEIKKDSIKCSVKIKKEKNLSKIQSNEIIQEGKIVAFKINAPHAKNVMLCGDFNNWDYKNTPLIKDKDSDLWKKEIFMKPGRYEYKFIVDGNWLIDPFNVNKAWNNYGSENSVIEIK